jgi:hypothetical protein
VRPWTSCTQNTMKKLDRQRRTLNRPSFHGRRAAPGRTRHIFSDLSIALGSLSERDIAYCHGSVYVTVSNRQSGIVNHLHMCSRGAGYHSGRFTSQFWLSSRLGKAACALRTNRTATPLRFVNATSTILEGGPEAITGAIQATATERDGLAWLQPPAHNQPTKVTLIEKKIKGKLRT